MTDLRGYQAPAPPGAQGHISYHYPLDSTTGSIETVVEPLDMDWMSQDRSPGRGRRSFTLSHAPPRPRGCTYSTFHHVHPATSTGCDVKNGVEWGVRPGWRDQDLSSPDRQVLAHAAGHGARSSRRASGVRGDARFPRLERTGRGCLERPFPEIAIPDRAHRWFSSRQTARRSPSSYSVPGTAHWQHRLDAWGPWPRRTVPASGPSRQDASTIAPRRLSRSRHSLPRARLWES